MAVIESDHQAALRCRLAAMAAIAVEEMTAAAVAAEPLRLHRRANSPQSPGTAAPSTSCPVGRQSSRPGRILKRDQKSALRDGRAVEEPGNAPARVVVTGSQGVQEGTGNLQVNYWFQGPPDEEAEAFRDLVDGLRASLKNEQDRLGIEAPEPLKVGWQQVDRYGQLDRSLNRAGTIDDIKDLYKEISPGEDSPGRLVILGASGSGKSVLLQLLAQGMLGDIREEKPIVPVIFNLGSWEAGAQLDEWLSGQLLRLHYSPSISEKLARNLIAKNRILPFLDGFDEIGEPARRYLLDWLNNNARRPFILTSRVEEFKAETARKDRNGTSLLNAKVIQLTDLPLDQVIYYLKHLPDTRTRSPDTKTENAWSLIIDELKAENKSPEAEILADALKTPLTVSLARDVYREEDPHELIIGRKTDGENTAREKFDSAEDIRNHLLDDFIKARYETLKDPSPWGKEEAHRAFRFLAVRLAWMGSQPRRDDKEIAWWEIGTAGMTPLRRSLVSGLVGGLALAFMNGIFSFAAVLGAAGIKISPVYALELVSGHAIIVGTAFGLAHWFTIKYRSQLLEPSRVRIAFSRRPPAPRGASRAGGNDEDSPVRRFRDGLVIGGIGAFVGIFGISAFDTILSGHWFGSQDGAHVTLPAGLTLTLVFVLGFTLDMGFALGFIVAFFEVPMQAKDAAGPLALLAANRRTMVWGGLVVGIGNGAVMGVIDGMIQGPVMGFAFATVGGFTILVGGVLTETGWGQWVLYCRVWLPLTGQLPWRMCEFLRDAHRRGVLRQIGGLYQFRHESLQARILQDGERTRRGGLSPGRHGSGDPDRRNETALAGIERARRGDVAIEEDRSAPCGEQRDVNGDRMHGDPRDARLSEDDRGERSGCRHVERAGSRQSRLGHGQRHGAVDISLRRYHHGIDRRHAVERCRAQEMS